MAISFMPVVGSALQVAFNESAGRRLQDRRTRWLNDLAGKVHELEGQIGDFGHLASQDAFMDALTTAAQIADRTSRTEKLESLRNAVINSVLPGAPELDLQQLFFDMLNQFTPTHVRLLTLLSDPLGWFERHGIAKPNLHAGSKAVIVAAGLPELEGREDLVARYARGLEAAGLISQSLTGMMSEAGLWARSTTPLASEFLGFLADPSTKVDQGR